MPTAHVNGIAIEFETSGDQADPALLMVMGLGGQLIAWPQAFVEELAARGFFVIRYDNRDIGLSTKFDGTPDFGALFTGDGSSASYRIEDMADDASALLAHLGIDAAHVMGVSMGGMITQALVINHPERVPHGLFDHVDHGRPCRGRAHGRSGDGAPATAGHQPRRSRGRQR